MIHGHSVRQEQSSGQRSSAAVETCKHGCDRSTRRVGCKKLLLYILKVADWKLIRSLVSRSWTAIVVWSDDIRKSRCSWVCKASISLTWDFGMISQWTFPAGAQSWKAMHCSSYGKFSWAIKLSRKWTVLREPRNQWFGDCFDCRSDTEALLSLPKSIAWDIGEVSSFQSWSKLETGKVGMKFSKIVPRPLSRGFIARAGSRHHCLFGK